jgi:hypothetical protein
MTDELGQDGLSAEELGAEGATALPDKEVVSILDLNADINLAIDAAAPIDLAAAANANVAAPIDASVGANVLSVGSTAQALSDQGVLIDQGLDADATAHAEQGSAIDQGADTATAADAAPAGEAAPAGDAGGLAAPATAAGTDPVSGAVDGATGDLGAGALDGNLLDVDVTVDADADIAAPINGAVAANANVAAPIDAAVGANVGSVDSDAVAVSQQDAIVHQDLHGNAEATSDQSSDIDQ